MILVVEFGIFLPFNPIAPPGRLPERRFRFPAPESSGERNGGPDFFREWENAMTDISTPDARAAEFLRRDIFAREMGIELLEARDGFAVARLTLTEHHVNGLGLAHGGVVFSLADLAFAAAANFGDAVAVAINATIAFVHPGKPGGTLTATARETSRGGRLATHAVDVRDETGRTVATFQGLAYRKSGQIPKSQNPVIRT